MMSLSNSLSNHSSFRSSNSSVTNSQRSFSKYDDDKSDRKAMDLLISNLNKQKEEHSKSAPKGTNDTGRNGWFKSKIPPRDMTPTKRKRKQPKARKTTTAPKKTSKSTKLNEQQSEMFKRYGIIIPTSDEILKSVENLNVCKELLDQCKTDEVYKPKKLKDRPTKKPQEKLNCTHLSLDDLSEGFEKHKEYVRGIFSGEIDSERHRIFYKKTKTNGNLFKELTCSPSTYVFAYEQKKHLIILLKKFFGGDYDEQYTFKVLLPELCLKIFMDAHYMNTKEAIAYLDNMPMDA